MSQHDLSDELFVINMIDRHVKLVKKLATYTGLLQKLGVVKDSVIAEEYSFQESKVRKIRDRLGIPKSPKEEEPVIDDGKLRMKVGGVKVERDLLIEVWNDADSPAKAAVALGVTLESSSNPVAAVCSAATQLRKKGFTLKRFTRGRPKKVRAVEAAPVPEVVREVLASEPTVEAESTVQVDTTTVTVVGEEVTADAAVAAAAIQMLLDEV